MEYVCKAELGGGSDGMVYLVQDSRYTEENETFALKQFGCTEEDIYQDEIYFLRLFQMYPYFPKVFDYFRSTKHFNIVMEFFPGGNLYDYYSKCVSFNPWQLRIIAAELSFSINLLHRKNILHLDIKETNVVISKTGHTTLIDFGRTLEIEDYEECRGQTGTDGYMSPEMISKQSFSYATDFWSLGIMLHILATGKHPFNFDRSNKNVDCIVEKEPELDGSLPYDLKLFIKDLLEQDPVKRLGNDPKKFHLIENHFYFKDIIWGEIYDGKGPAPFSDFKANEISLLEKARFISAN